MLAVVALRRLDLLDTPMEVVLGGGVLDRPRPAADDLIERRFAGGRPQAKLSSPTPRPSWAPPCSAWTPSAPPRRPRPACAPTFTP